jgi:hypothetical protein
VPVPSEIGRYRFPPLERRGLIAGLGGAQLAVAGAGCVAAVLVLSVVHTLAAPLLAAAVLAAAGAGACWTVAGRSPSAWMPVAAGWLARRRQARPTDAPGVGTTPDGPPRTAPRAELAGVTISAAPPISGSPPMGVVRDLKAGTVAAMVAVHGRSFSLLDPAEKQRRLTAWGTVLAGLCRDGSPVHRIQWIERATPAANDGLRTFLDEAGRADGSVRDSYAELIGEAGPVGQAHGSLLVLALDRRKAARAARPFGRGHGALCALLRRELRLLQGQLRNADLVVSRVLSDTDVAATLRAAIDPPHLRRSSGPTVPAADGQPDGARRSTTGPWPMATDEGWSSFRTDGAWHASYWVSDWPRIDVGPDFLSPLLLVPTGHRSAAVVMAPVPPGRAAREVEAARTADLADEQLRQKAGFLSTARRKREAEGVLQRESELADGHAEYRFSGYVTVSAPDRAQLEVASAEIEQAARQSNLELRRLYGQQAEAFTWTLPLARGLRG